jgi:hypothetical protein
MDELNGPKIHRLANILTLGVYLHTQFDRLALWFEANDVSSYYSYRFYSVVALHTCLEQQDIWIISWMT